jgi:hypothetical protein
MKKHYGVGPETSRAPNGNFPGFSLIQVDSPKALNQDPLLPAKFQENKR